MSSIKLKLALQHVLGKAEGNEIQAILDAVEALGGAETAFLDGVSAGTAAASKALVLDADLGITTIVSAGITTLSGSVHVFNGATGVNEIRVPTNLADALSVESSAGDILVVDTTTNAVAITITTSAASGLTLAGHVTVGDAKNVILNTTTGTKIGTAVGQKLGFWNATPVVQQASADQAAVAAITGGESPTEAEHNALLTLVLAIRTALVNTGIIKGSA
jgi:hypothetical protein